MVHHNRLAYGLLGGLVMALAALNVYQYATASRQAPVAGPGIEGSAAAPPAAAPPVEDTPQGPESPPPLTDEQRRVVEDFHKLSYDRQFGYWFHPVLDGLPRTMGVSGYGTPSRWLGVVTAQNPFDTWIHQEIIAEVKPDLIVETGTYFGGSALIWAMVLEQVNPEGKIVTIDIYDKTEHARDYPIWKDRVEFLEGSSVDPAVVSKVKGRAEGKRVLVILDSLHTRTHVQGELAAYASLVGEGSYVIVHDTNFGGRPVLPEYGEGPHEAVQEFLASHPEFEVDRDRERFLFTIHPGGYLRRVRRDAAASSHGDRVPSRDR